MNAVMRWRVENMFERAERFDKFCVDPELIDQIKPVHYQKHPRGKPEQYYRRIKHPANRPAEPALADRDAQIILLARVVNDVKIPKQTRFVARTVKNVIREIIDEKQDHPAPPRIGREFVRGQFVAKQIYPARRQPEQSSPQNAHKPVENIAPSVLPINVLARIPPMRP